MINCLFVGLGGGIGAVARYMMSKIHISCIPYPVNTFIINIIGALLIGLFIAAGDRLGFSNTKLMLFLTTGLCGGFSTLSALSNESLMMITSGRLGAAILYCTLTIVICILATWTGSFIGRLGA